MWRIRGSGVSCLPGRRVRISPHLLATAFARHNRSENVAISSLVRTGHKIMPVKEHACALGTIAFVPAALELEKQGQSHVSYIGSSLPDLTAIKYSRLYSTLRERSSSLWGQNMLIERESHRDIAPR